MTQYWVRVRFATGVEQTWSYDRPLLRGLALIAMLAYVDVIDQGEIDPTETKSLAVR